MGKNLLLFVAVLGTVCVSVASAQEQFPMMDRIAARVVEKYQRHHVSNSGPSAASPSQHRCSGLFNCCTTTRRCGEHLSTE